MIRHLFGSEDCYVITGSYDRMDRAEDAPRRLRDWRHGYAKFHTARGRVGAEWHALKPRRAGFGVGATFARLGDESGVRVSLYGGRAGSLRLKFRHPVLRPVVAARRSRDRRYADLVTGLRLFPHPGCYVDWQFEDTEGAWSRSDPWWQRWSLNDRHVWGRDNCTTESTAAVPIVVSMPEGDYAGTARQERRVWRHSRWPGTWLDRVRPRERTSWSLDVPGGIPVQGKGENSYDCGMDGCFGRSGGDDRTAEEAAAGLRDYVLDRRQRYGGPHNLPRAMTVTEAAARAGGVSGYVREQWAAPFAWWEVPGVPARPQLTGEPEPTDDDMRVEVRQVGDSVEVWLRSDHGATVTMGGESPQPWFRHSFGHDAAPFALVSVELVPRVARLARLLADALDAAVPQPKEDPDARP